MKKRTVLKSVAALALTVVMVLALALPALASANQIKIDAPIEEPGDANRFVAYQVFSGALVSGKPDEINGITWGSGVNETDLLAALKGSNQPVPKQTGDPYDDGMLTFGAQFTAAYGEYEKEHSKQLTVPEFVAQWLGTVSASYTNAGTYNPYADAFARAVGANLKTPKGTTTKTVDGSGAHWTIDVGDPGYYLVKDTYSGTAASVSSYILRVLGSTTVTIKASIPTVTKKVDGVDGVLTETETEHTFTLTGTVSKNINEYGTYAYTFTDTISKGLTVTEAQQKALYVDYINGDVTRRFTKDVDYTVTYVPDGSDGAHTLTVTFNDLKKSLNDRVTNPNIDLTNATVVEGIKIVVTYKAQLNENAVIGDAGNPNTVTLTYSNDPYSHGTGVTNPDEVKTYTLALRIVKKNADGDFLQNVEFKLMKGDSSDHSTAQFATFKVGTGAAGIGQGQQETYQEINSWVTGIDAGGVLETDTSGEFNIHGLSAGTYTLVETKAPEGYETMQPIEFTITGEVDGTGKLTKAELSTNETTRQDVHFSNTSLLAHNGQLTLTNYPLPILPHTGGIGAGIVYLVSALAVVTGAAIVYLATRKRGRGRHEQSR